MSDLYQFGKFGTLHRFAGLPLYAGRVRISKSHIVWWWPINWVVVLVALPSALIVAIRQGRAKP